MKTFITIAITTALIIIGVSSSAKAEGSCDLTVTQVSRTFACSSNPSIPCAFAFSAYVKNIGTEFCPATTTQIIVDGRHNLISTLGLPPTATFIANTPFQTPVVNGYYWVEAKANYNFPIFEENYRNNQLSGLVEVRR